MAKGYDSPASMGKGHRQAQMLGYNIVVKFSDDPTLPAPGGRELGVSDYDALALVQLMRRGQCKGVEIVGFTVDQLEDMATATSMLDDSVRRLLLARKRGKRQPRR